MGGRLETICPDYTSHRDGWKKRGRVKFEEGGRRATQEAFLSMARSNALGTSIATKRLAAYRQSSPLTAPDIEVILFVD